MNPAVQLPEIAVGESETITKITTGTNVFYFSVYDSITGTIAIYSSNGTAHELLIPAGTISTESALVTNGDELYLIASTFATGAQIYYSATGASISMIFNGLTTAPGVQWDLAYKPWIAFGGRFYVYSAGCATILQFQNGVLEYEVVGGGAFDCNSTGIALSSYGGKLAFYADYFNGPILLHDPVLHTLDTLPCPIYAFGLAESNGILYFGSGTAFNWSVGTWDGAVCATVGVNTDPIYYWPYGNGVLYFKGAGHHELYFGDTSGVAAVADTRPGNSDQPQGMAVSGTDAYYRAYDPANIYATFYYDGAVATKVDNGIGYDTTTIPLAGNTAFFRKSEPIAGAPQTLWQATAGVRSRTDLPYGPLSDDTAVLAAAGMSLYFSANDGTNIRLYRLNTETEVVTTLDYGAGTDCHTPVAAWATATEIIFQGTGLGGNQYCTIVNDAVSVVVDTPQYADYTSLFVANGYLYGMKNDGSGNKKLNIWQAGAWTQILDAFPGVGENYGGSANANGIAYVAIYNGGVTDQRVYALDGASATLFRDALGAVPEYADLRSGPDGSLFFTETTAIGSGKLFRSDGVTTTQIVDLNPAGNDDIAYLGMSGGKYIFTSSVLVPETIYLYANGVLTEIPHNTGFDYTFSSPTSWTSIYQAFHAGGYTYFFGGDINNFGADGLKLLVYDGATVYQASWSNTGGDDFLDPANPWTPDPTPILIGDVLYYRNADGAGRMKLHYATNGGWAGTVADQYPAGSDFLSTMTELNGNLYMNFSDTAVPSLSKLYRYRP